MNTRLTQIRLNCTIFKENNDLITKLTAIVTYKTGYKDDNIKPVILSFRNRKYVAVKAIMRKTNLKKWRANIYFDENLLVLKKLNTKFALKYIIADSGMLVNVKINSKDFSDCLS